MNGFVQNLPRPPSKKERQAELEGRVLNPLKLFAMLSPMQHALFWSAWSVYHPCNATSTAYLNEQSGLLGLPMPMYVTA